MTKLAVIALGGNALLRDNQSGTIEEQEQNTLETLENLVFLLKDGYNIVITHGNGPQVGNLLLQNDAGETIYNLPSMPLDICVAMSQGSIGYMIERMMHMVLHKHNLPHEVVTLVTMAVVDNNDEAFKNPSKRVGKIYTEEQKNELAKTKGWIFKEEVKTQGGWRRVVPSPKPISIMNENVVATMARQGTIVIASGGGGIPVYIDEENNIRATDAVIDKDLASSLLASRIEADEFYILTDVPYIYKNYKQPDQEILEFLNRADALKYLEAGTFGEGSMAPKIRAAIQFIENGGRMSVITEATKLEDKKYGSKITMEYED